MSNDKMREALMQIRNALQLANHMGGPICDTIWMPNTPETLFDFIDSTRSAQASAEPVGYITKHGADLLREKRGYSTNVRGPLACEYENLNIHGMVAVYTHPPRAAGPVVPEAMQRLIDTCNDLDFEAEEYEFPDGLGRGAAQQHWDAFSAALEAVTELLATSAPSEPKRVELTDAEIVVVMREGYGCRENDEQDHIEFARAVIAAHDKANGVTK